MKRSFRKAKRLGIIVVLLPGTPEENYICDLVTEENKKMKITSTDPYTYKKRLRYLNSSLPYIDMVIGSLPPVYQSYSNSKVFKGQVVRLLGHMTPDFTPLNVIERTITDNYKVGYIAHTVMLKGLHYLIEAWTDLMQDPANHSMTLYVGGNIEKDVLDYINTRFAPFKNIIMAGHVKDVSTFLQPLDLFIVPSLIDGGPITALEAAHLAVPVIITDNCGSSELLGRGDGGCITIPIKDAHAIKESILWAYNNREEAIKIGQNGKKNLDGYRMEKFISEIADHLEYNI